MHVAGFVIAIVALCASVTAAILVAVYLGRLRRVYLTQTAMVLARLEELEGDVRQLGENGYILTRMLLDKGIVNEDEVAAAFTVFVEEARAQAREHAALLKEWKDRTDKDGILVEELPKTTH